MTKRINQFDRDDDFDRISRGQDPIYNTRAEYGLEERPSAESVKIQPHSYRLSQPAHQALTRVKAAIDELRPLASASTSSVAVEFLVWVFEEVSKAGTLPATGGFSQQTRRGRPALGFTDTPLSPGEARKGLGLVDLVQKRKLR